MCRVMSMLFTTPLSVDPMIPLAFADGGATLDQSRLMLAKRYTWQSDSRLKTGCVGIASASDLRDDCALVS